MKNLQSINPYTGKLIQEYQQTTENGMQQMIGSLEAGYQTWRFQSVSSRGEILRIVADRLIQQKDELAKTISLEMGKPIKQSIAEIEKCAWACNYYVETAEAALSKKMIETDASESFVNYHPIGILLAVMPWNYPFWQFFRVLAPNLMLGNVLLLKHASNVSACALAIKALFEDLPIDYQIMDTALIESKRVASFIEHPLVKAVTLTGSEKAGASVAATAGKMIKKAVLELGGNNAVIILEDADLEKHMDEIVNARFQNTGQSCIAGKRFLVQAAIYDTFIDSFKKKVATLQYGDPLNASSTIGPMASEALAEELEKQLQDSLKNGNTLLLGGKRTKAQFDATIVVLKDINCPIFREETFGPLAAIKTFTTPEEAIRLSNDSDFGLGVSIFTENTILALEMQERLDEGAVFINSLVKSDPRLPFGGVKKSGFGRELSDEALKEFANIKTVYVK